MACWNVLVMFFFVGYVFSIIVYGLFILSVAIVMDCWISDCPIRSVF